MKASNLGWLLRGMAMVALSLVAACRSDTVPVREGRGKSPPRNFSEHVRTPLRISVNRDTKQARLPAREARPTLVTAAVVPGMGETRRLSSGGEAYQTPPSDRAAGQPKFVQAGLFTVPNLGGSSQAKTRLIAFESSAFPYNGLIPGTQTPFMNIAEGERRGHRTAFNRVYWEDETYNDPRTLLHIPAGFDIQKPGVMVLFFHGHGATLEHDVEVRQQVPEQITASGANAVLVAPQLAVNARDSSPGKFWEPGGLKRFLDEASDKLARLHGDPSARAKFAKMPIVVVAYSGGYVAAAWGLTHGGVASRVKGVVLMDALYGEFGKFTSWIKDHRSAFFISAFANSTRAKNGDFEHELAAHGIPVKTELAGGIRPGDVTFISTSTDTLHRDFVTEAWTEYPISDVLHRLELPRRPSKTAAVR